MRNSWWVAHHRISEAASVLGVSDDTLRRWIDHGRITATVGSDGRAGIEGEDLARLALELADAGHEGLFDRQRAHSVSARNRLRGIVVAVKRDPVMSQVELVCGPYRIVSLMSTDAADELGLEPGVIAVPPSSSPT